MSPINVTNYLDIVSVENGEADDDAGSGLVSEGSADHDQEQHCRRRRN